jgi:hypothetical protein
LFSPEVENDKTKIARQAEEDCEASYFAEDVGQDMPCILSAGHDGKHVDPTGIEF